MGRCQYQANLYQRMPDAGGNARYRATGDLEHDSAGPSAPPGGWLHNLNRKYDCMQTRAPQKTGLNNSK